MTYVLRICAAVWFFLCGITLVMFLGLSAPGHIYYSSAVLLVGVSFIWPWFPAVAGCVSLPLVTGLTYMLCRYPFGLFGIIYGIAFAACYLLIGIALCERVAQVSRGSRLG